MSENRSNTTGYSIRFLAQVFDRILIEDPVKHGLVSSEASIELQPTWPRFDVEFNRKRGAGSSTANIC